VVLILFYGHTFFIFKNLFVKTLILITLNNHYFIYSRIENHFSSCIFSFSRSFTARSLSLLNLWFHLFFSHFLSSLPSTSYYFVVLKGVKRIIPTCEALRACIGIKQSKKCVNLFSSSLLSWQSLESKIVEKFLI
jgi:hypothetical protein